MTGKYTLALSAHVTGVFPSGEIGIYRETVAGLSLYPVSGGASVLPSYLYRSMFIIQLLVLSTYVKCGIRLGYICGHLRGISIVEY